MAKSVQTDAGPIYIPNAYSKYTVQSSPTGLATSGVIMIVGEADGGPSFASETDLEETCSFGPDQFADVQAKYLGGPLVDAFRGAIAASSDRAITGSFQRAILVKTNAGTRASVSLNKIDGSSGWATVYAKSEGTSGNQTTVQTQLTGGGVTTGSFTYIPRHEATSLSIVVNGNVNSNYAPVVDSPPSTFVSGFNGAVSGTAIATGGASVAIIAGTGGAETLAVAATGNSVTITKSAAWVAPPVVGNTLIIPSGSVIEGASNENVGAYVVTAVGSNTVTATKLSNYTLATVSVTAPTNVSAVSTGAATDLQNFTAVSVAVTAANTVLSGQSSSLEFADNNGNFLAYTLGTTTPVTWLSTASNPQLVIPTAETKLSITVAKGLTVENFSSIGGDVPLRLSYTGGAATITISESTVTLSTGPSKPVADFANVSELAAWINNLGAAYSASVGTAVLGALKVTDLDRGSFTIYSKYGAENGRIKVDGKRTYDAVALSGLITLDVRPVSGVPEATAATYLSGGLLGSTSNTDILAAFAKLETVYGNFLVPAFSRDASNDIADELTDPSSSYTISYINQAAKDHVIAMSQIKRRKNRQAIVSLQDTFVNQQNAAANTASFRVGMTFENPMDVDTTGTIQTYQPWYAAVKAAAMQAAGFYRAITNKQVNITGLKHEGGGFDPKNDSNQEDALKAGLMPIKPRRSGGWVWTSDQTTYGLDDNFVLNSLQAVYTADLVSVSTAELMEQAFVGQSTADVSANLALTYLDQIMSQMRALKLIVASDDAPRGYKNAKIRISGNVMYVSLEIKLATGIDFILIDFLISKTEQTAG